MMNVIKNNRWLLLLLAVLIFTRFFSLGQLYHQDEYRWVQIADTAEFGKLDSPHPPMMEAFLSLAGRLFGYDNLRIIPFFLSILNLILIYAVSLRLTGNRKIAYIASGLFVINVYSLIAGLMLDIDGELLPLFVISAYYLYLKSIVGGNRKLILPLAGVMVLGFLTKISFVLFAGALAVEYLWTLYDGGKFKNQIKKAGIYLGTVGLVIFGLYFMYGKSDPYFIKYASNFKIFDFGSRKYFDLLLRLFKFVIWFSPLLLLPMTAGLFKKDIFKKYRIWYVYTLFNFIFYLVIFDFATLPIERYFMFIIIPAVLIGADVIYRLISGVNRKHLTIITVGFFILLNFTILVAHDVVPLNPKEAYIEKVKDLNFNFLIPLTGGSGPIGFYGSAQFILWTWVLCIAGLLLSKKKWAVSLFLVFGIGYNILFSLENLTGVIYGSVNKITKDSLEYVINNPQIDGVITYYDAGVYYLKVAGKYDARFYTAPSRDYTERMNAYRGHYMIVDFPAVDKNGLYWKIISRCNLEKKFTDKYVNSYIFDCRSLPSYTLDKTL